jgi:hypothetical protein
MWGSAESGQRAKIFFSIPKTKFGDKTKRFFLTLGNISDIKTVIVKELSELGRSPVPGFLHAQVFAASAERQNWRPTSWAFLQNEPERPSLHPCVA